MRPTPWPAAALLLTTLAGCATAPMYVQEIPPNAACIQGDAPGWIGAAPGGGARVSILEIDGYGITGGGPQCVAPGQHRLGVRAVAGNQAVQEYVDLNLQGGRLYALRAQSHGIAFVFSLVDVTGGAEASVARFSLRAGYVGVAAPPSVYYYPSYTEAYIGGGAARPRHQRPPAPHAQGPAPAPVVSPPTPLPEHRPNRKGPAWSGNQGSRCAGGGTGLAECIGQQDRRDNHRRPGPPPANGGDVGLTAPGGGGAEPGQAWHPSLRPTRPGAPTKPPNAHDGGAGLAVPGAGVGTPGASRPPTPLGDPPSPPPSANGGGVGLMAPGADSGSGSRDRQPPAMGHHPGTPSGQPQPMPSVPPIIAPVPQAVPEPPRPVPQAAPEMPSRPEAQSRPEPQHQAPPAPPSAPTPALSSEPAPAPAPEPAPAPAAVPVPPAPPG